MDFFKSFFYVLILLALIAIGIGVWRMNKHIPLNRNVVFVPVLIPGSEKDKPLEPYVPDTTNPDIDFMLSELNQYRTNKGTIKIKPNRIHAGLYNREWSVEYYIPKPYHEAGFFAGTFWGLYYQYNIFKSFTVGAAAIVQDKEAGFAISAGYKF
jgi:hypothetical protein